MFQDLILVIPQVCLSCFWVFFCGYSIIPCAPQHCTPVISVVHFFGRTDVKYVFEDDDLTVVLKLFHDSKQHIAIVRVVDDSDPTVRCDCCCIPSSTSHRPSVPALQRDPVYRMSGLITLENVVEVILQRECFSHLPTDCGERFPLLPACRRHHG